MPLDLFRNQYVRHLQRNVGPNLALYAERKSWAARPATGVASRLPSALEPAVPLELELPAGGDQKDLENTKLVHAAFPSLTPLQARDPRTAEHP